MAAAHLAIQLWNARAEHKVDQSRVRMLRSRGNTSGPLTRDQMDSSVALFALSGLRADCAICSLQRRVPAYASLDQVQSRELAAAIQEWYISAPLDLLLRFMLPEDEQAERFAQRHVQMVAEHQLLKWTVACNRQLGLAPSTEDVMRRFANEFILVARLAHNVLPPLSSLSDPQCHAARQWVYRWRHRWGVRHGKLRAREDLEQTAMRNKAGRLQTLCPGSALKDSFCS